MRVVATAGHVDHGKSSLVMALTGTNPDRWEEERRRGLTIDLGFAHTTLANGEDVSFIDVPGHVRFLRNMLAGVGGVDACVFVVAATEGWKPQSEEHLRILQLVGLRYGLIALTKIDAVDEEWSALQEMDLRDRLAGSFLADAPIIGESAVTGEGMDDLRRGLERLVAETPSPQDRSRPKPWVDPVFAAKGSVTVAGKLLPCAIEGEQAPLHVAGKNHIIGVLDQFLKATLENLALLGVLGQIPVLKVHLQPERKGRTTRQRHSKGKYPQQGQGPSP